MWIFLLSIGPILFQSLFCLEISTGKLVCSLCVCMCVCVHLNSDNLKGVYKKKKELNRVVARRSHCYQWQSSEEVYECCHISINHYWHNGQGISESIGWSDMLYFSATGQTQCGHELCFAPSPCRHCCW